MSIKVLIAKSVSANTAAYGCELTVKSKTEIAPSINEIVVLLFTQAVA